MEEIRGYEGKLYYNYAAAFGGAGTYEAPDWDEITCVRDVSMDTERSEYDGTTRASGGFEAASAGLAKAPLNLEVLHVPGDAGYDALRLAFCTNIKIELLVVDRAYDAEDATGLRATWAVLKFSQPQPIDGLMICSLTIKPAIADNPPAWWPVA